MGFVWGGLRLMQFMLFLAMFAMSVVFANLGTPCYPFESGQVGTL